jgi:hypothetical protein
MFVPPEYVDRIGQKGWPDFAGEQVRAFRFRVEVKHEDS